MIWHLYYLVLALMFVAIWRPKWRRRYTPLSRSKVYLHPCRSSFRSRAGVAATPLPKGPGAPHPKPPCRVSQELWTSQTLSRSKGCSCYPCGVALHFDTKFKTACKMFLKVCSTLRFGSCWTSRLNNCSFAGHQFKTGNCKAVECCGQVRARKRIWGRGKLRQQLLTYCKRSRLDAVWNQWMLAFSTFPSSKKVFAKTGQWWRLPVRSSMDFSELRSCFNSLLLCLRSRKIMWIFFSHLPGDLALKKGGDFWWIFCGLHFLGNKARKILGKFGKISCTRTCQRRTSAYTIGLRMLFKHAAEDLRTPAQSSRSFAPPWFNPPPPTKSLHE